MPPDYSGQNLRGRSFKGQNLTGANFSGADIRGADFSNANLKEANFTGAKAGLQRRWTIGLLIALLFLSALSGFASEYVIYVLYRLIDPNTDFRYRITSGVATLVVLIFFSFLTTYKNLDTSLNVSIFISAIASSVLTATITTLNIDDYKRSSGAAFAGVVAATIVDAGIINSAIIILGANKVKSSIFWRLAVIVGCAAFSSSIVVSATRHNIDHPSYFRVVTGIVIISILILSVHIAQNAMQGDERYGLIYKRAIAFGSTGGTSFHGADLTDADFTGATLTSTDFRKANLTRTCFYEAKKLDFARVGDSILAKRAILNLLVTGNGRGKSYVGANLKGANLRDADLKEANLKDADISEATFQGACLEWANLTLAQAVGTNFTNAHMTGVCVEAWNIESTTKLDNVDCHFVYLLENFKPGTDDRERRPSSGEFQPGEFTKLFEEVLNTVDLIFRDGIDWKAFVTAFKQVQVENEDTELVIQSIENKGDGVVVVKVNVPLDANKEKLYRDFTQNYPLALQAIEEKYKAQLQAKDKQIEEHRQKYADMKEIVGLLASKPVNVQFENKLDNKNMTNSNDASRKIEIGSVGRDFNASGQALNLGDISGTVINTINELPKSPEPEKPGIKELLTQLQEAIEAEKDLPEEDKAEALEQVKTLAEAGKNPQEGEKQKEAKTAIKILKGTIAGLPTAATLAEACSKLLPLISKFLGLG
ncbi:pentapeptide repeat-containing protein [Mastigocladopsis repens]|uniref:pentapeptide repeat-containing protein n=1 Tax=Mastigocladopsis repens TaxID=221287 RepID=UPI00030399E3|nr:pentapeptide repeat-containing protein [Mastigocladopsis repens]